MASGEWRVASGEWWVVGSSQGALTPYGIVATLPGVDRLAEMNGLGRGDLLLLPALAQRRDVLGCIRN
jgi:hypothetical protein